MINRSFYCLSLFGILSLSHLSHANPANPTHGHCQTVDPSACGWSGNNISGGSAAPQKSEAERRSDQINAVFNSNINMMSAHLNLMLFEIKKRQNGFWENFGPQLTVEKGFHSCSALYIQNNHYLMVWGSNKPGAQAMIMFIDANKNAVMNPIDSPKIQQVTLEQTGAQPITINAIRHSLDGYGAITFAIPTLDMAASGLRNEMNIKVTSGKHELIKMSYHAGNIAKAKLENCIEKLPKL